MAISRAGHFLLIVLITTSFAFTFRWWTSDDASRAESRHRLATVLIPDIKPRKTLRVSGDVAVIGIVGTQEPVNAQTVRIDGKFRQGCEALCAALLATPAVRSVTVVPLAEDGESQLRQRATRFRLVPKTSCHGGTVKPQNPDRMTPLVVQRGSTSIIEIAANNAFATAWSLRLASIDCIVAEAPARPYDLTITYSRFNRFGSLKKVDDWHWSRDPLPVKVTRLVIRAKGGEILLRQTIGSTQIIDRPRLPGVVDISGYATPVIGWLRTNLTNGDLIPGTGLVQEVDADTAILSFTDVHPRNVGVGGAVRRIRQRLDAAVRNSSLSATDPMFDLLDPWMRSLAGRPTERADFQLVVAIIRDHRVTKFEGLGDATKAFGFQAVQLRRPILDRLDSTAVPPSVGKPLSAQLPLIARIVPPSTDDQVVGARILSDPEKRLSAKGLIIEQADRGGSAVPLLLQIIREHSQRWTKRSNFAAEREIDPIDGARVALCRIGPQGLAAEKMKGLLLQTRVPPTITRDYEWRAMLVRIGFPLAEVVSKTNPLDRTAETKTLTAISTRFDAARDCGEAYD